MCIRDRYIPALMITGDTSSNLIREFGQNDFEVLHKPIKPGVLLAKINSEISAGNNAGKALDADSKAAAWSSGSAVNQ